MCKSVNYDQTFESAQLQCINHLNDDKNLETTTLLGKGVDETCSTSNRQSSEDVKPKIFAIFLQRQQKKLANDNTRLESYVKGSTRFCNSCNK